jgi:putative transposase
VLSKRASSAISDRLPHAEDAFWPRDLSGYEVAYLFIDPVYEPRRRWGRKTGVRCGWGLCVDGRQGRLALSPAHSESDESGLEMWRALITRGWPPPVTSTTAGAPGLLKAVDLVWPRSLRMRCWFQKMQTLAQQVPPQAWPAFKALVVDRRDAPSIAEGHRPFQHLLPQ